jgi:GT2 family glycosyltransferase
MTYQKKPNTRISIGIVNWNTRELLDKCLESIYLQTQSDLFEIVVIDNASKDDSCDMVKTKYPQVKLIINQENLGFAKATNQGFDVSTGDYVLMLNSDTVILDRAIEKTLDFADKNPDSAVVGCKLIYPDGRFQNSCFRFPGFLGIFFESIYLAQLFKNNYLLNWSRYGYQDKNWTVPRTVDCVMGCFMLIRHPVLKEVGQLDTDYFIFGEEADFEYRVKKAGYKVTYYPKTQIIHIGGGSQKTLQDIVWSYKAIYRGIFFFLYKWFPIKAYVSNVIFVIFMLPRLFFWAIFDIKSFLIHKGKFSKQNLLNVSTFKFHLKAIFHPGLFAKKWDKNI